MFNFVPPSQVRAVRRLTPTNLGIRLVAMALILGLVGACTAHRPKACSVVGDATVDSDTAQRARHTLEHLYPQQYRAIQRAIITVGKQQYVCDGVLTASPDSGHHLAVINTLGLVTELQVKTNRTSELIRSTPLFREDWSRNFVARDLQRLFAPAPGTARAGRLKDGRFALESIPTVEGHLTRYVFSHNGRRLQEVEVEQRGKRVYHATVRRYRTFAGVDREIPSEIAVTAPSYSLNLRTAEFTVPASSNASTTTQ
jgi:hypothetical protein